MRNIVAKIYDNSAIGMCPSGDCFEMKSIVKKEDSLCPICRSDVCNIELHLSKIGEFIQGNCFSTKVDNKYLNFFKKQLSNYSLRPKKH